MRVEEAKFLPATGLTVTATKLGRQLKAGHELGQSLAAGYWGQGGAANTAWLVDAGREG